MRLVFEYLCYSKLEVKEHLSFSFTLRMKFWEILLRMSFSVLHYLPSNKPYLMCYTLCMYECVQASNQRGCLPLMFSALSFETGSLFEPGLASLARQAVFCLCPPVLGYRCVPLSTALHWCWGPALRPLCLHSKCLRYSWNHFLSLHSIFI